MKHKTRVKHIIVARSFCFEDTVNKAIERIESQKYTHIVSISYAAGEDWDSCLIVYTETRNPNE